MTGRKHVVNLVTLRRVGRGSSKPPAHNDGPTVQVGMRLDPGLVARLDAVAEKLSRPGLALTRADAIRICLETGVEKIEKAG